MELGDGEALGESKEKYSDFVSMAVQHFGLGLNLSWAKQHYSHLHCAPATHSTVQPPVSHSGCLCCAPFIGPTLWPPAPHSSCQSCVVVIGTTQGLLALHSVHPCHVVVACTTLLLPMLCSMLQPPEPYTSHLCCTKPMTLHSSHSLCTLAIHTMF